MFSGIRPQEGGYTVIELMTVLTISVAIVAGAIALFSTRIPQTQFSQGLAELEAKVRGVNNDVINGFYPSTNNIECGSLASSDATINPSGREQGTNENCIFMGKAIQFAPRLGNCTQPVDNSDECDKLIIYTVYGNKGDIKNIPEFNDVKPRILDPDNIYKEEYTTAFGLKITKVFNSDDSININGIAYLLTFGAQTSVSGSDPTGAPQTRLHRLLGDLGINSYGANNQIPNNADPSKAVTVCLRGGRNNQYATLTLGGNNNPASTAVNVLNESEWTAAGCS